MNIKNRCRDLHKGVWVPIIRRIPTPLSKDSYRSTSLKNPQDLRNPLIGHFTEDFAYDFTDN